MKTEGKINRISIGRPIELHWNGVDSILFDPAIQEIFYFKQHVVEAFNVIILLATLTLIALVTPSQF